VGLSVALALTVTACGSIAPTAAPGTVYFLNSNVGLISTYAQIAQVYHAQTGVDIQIFTAVEGAYEQTLAAEFARTREPSIFEIFGPQGYANHRGYVAEVSDSQLYAHLHDPTLAISNAAGVYGLPLGIEAFGIVYNDSLMKKYFALTTKAVSLTSAEQITSFSLLKQVVEDMTAHKEALGITGVFSAIPLGLEQTPRWQDHFADTALHDEFRDTADLTRVIPPEIDFTYGADMGNLFDLATTNCTHAPETLGDVTRAQGLVEFAMGRSIFLFGDTHTWEEVSAIQGNAVQEHNMHFLPLYIGGPGESTQGLSVSSPSYFAINSHVSAEDQQASLDFLYWLFSSKEGKMFVVNDLGFVSPYDTIAPDEGIPDPLAIDAVSWIARNGIKSVPYASWSFPDEQFGADFAKYLLAHAKGAMDWETVTAKVTESWTSGIVQ
jgi:raffinose/stachyose/melibiose transport system substrate-binding protein